MSTHPRSLLRRSGFALVAVLATTALAACSSSGSATSGAGNASGGAPTLDPNNPVKIRVSDTAGNGYLQIAKAEGFFKAVGLDPELSQVGDGNATLTAIEGGSLDIGYADFFAGINAVGHGFDLDLVANNNRNLVVYPILVKADGPIQSLNDLVGKKVGLSSIPQQTINTLGVLQNNGVDPSKVTLDYLSASTAADVALDRGDIQAWSAGHWPQLYENNGKQGYNFTAIGNYSTDSWSDPAATTAGWWSTGSYASNHPAVENAFAQALWNFHVWINQQPPSDLAALIKQYYKTDYVKIADGDATALKNLTYWPEEQHGPIDIDATQAWYELGVKDAPKSVTANVDWQSHVYQSAKNPLETITPTPPSAAAAGSAH